MTANTGRTVPDFTKLLLGAAAGSMLDMKINELGDIGLEYAIYRDYNAWSDAVKGVLIGKPDFTLDFGGPVDNTATTGPSTLMRTWNANHTLLSLDVQLGVQHAWETGEQQFGITGVVATKTGVVLTSYKENAGKYKATLACFSGSAAYPDYGTTAETVPA